jgi:hypothetical protein
MIRRRDAAPFVPSVPTPAHWGSSASALVTDRSDEKPTPSPTARVRNRQVGCELTIGPPVIVVGP